MSTLSPVESPCTFAAEAASVSAARWYADGVLTAWNVGDVSWTCLQLISELAANAVLHARTEFTLEISRHQDKLRVCVLDASPAQPALRRYGDDSTTGRGLRLVESMASTWGVQPMGFGKIIWFEVDLPQRGTAHAWDDGAEVDLEALLDSFDVDDDTGTPRACVRPASRLQPAAAA
jgi:anti-sigma regulatory factor (Ser/Thr protein kinase)